MKNNEVYKALTIAASDSSGGAGIQADIKAFSSVGVEGCSVITCITSQNTKEITEIYKLPKKTIESQIDAVMEDIKPNAVKTGMLYSKEIVDIVSKKLEQFEIKPIVDPVITSTIGTKLSTNNYLNSLKTKLLPIAKIVTPNLHEASEILGWEVKTIEDMKIASKEIYKFGCDYVLIKGGHLKKKAIDILYSGNSNFKEFQAKSINKEVHGTGCTFSALITANLAKKFDVENAVEIAKKLVTKAIKFSSKVGKGIEIANPLVNLYNSSEKYKVIKELKIVLDKLGDIPPSFVPQVGINIAYALPYATSLDDICAIEGRVILVNNKPKKIGCLDFAKSKHIAKIVLTAMQFMPKFRCAMNIKYNENIVKKFEKLNFKIGSFKREEEPEKVSTMEWGTKEVISKLGYVPDIIYDKGGVGKEPMIRIIGKNPNDVYNKLKKIMLA